MKHRKVRKFENGGVTADDLERANASDDPIYTLNKIKGFTDSDDSDSDSVSSSAAAPKSMSFKEAFAAARKGGGKTFEWQGKKYTTDLAKPAVKPASAPAPAPTPAPKPKYETPYDRMNRQNREAAAARKSSADSERSTLQKNIREGSSGRVNPKTLLPMKKGGMVTSSSASRRADGIAQRGKTRGRMM